MTVYLTSDLHLGHERVATLRGFDSVAEHDAAVADRWRALVKPRDTVWVLGDLAAASPVHALAILATLPGEKVLVAGNHDRCHPMHRDAHRRQAAYLTTGGGPFVATLSGARKRIGGEDVLLSHFPYLRDREEPRHLQWRLRDEGLPLVHGHTHGEERLTVTPAMMTDPWHGEPEEVAPRRIEVHVGVDAWGLSPVAEHDVAALIAEGRDS